MIALATVPATVPAIAHASVTASQGANARGRVPVRVTGLAGESRKRPNDRDSRSHSYIEPNFPIFPLFSSPVMPPRSRSRLRSRSHSPLVRQDSFDRGDKINRWGPSGARSHVLRDGRPEFRKSQPGIRLRKPAFDLKRMPRFDKVGPKFWKLWKPPLISSSLFNLRCRITKESSTALFTRFLAFIRSFPRIHSLARAHSFARSQTCRTRSFHSSNPSYNPSMPHFHLRVFIVLTSLALYS